MADDGVGDVAVGLDGGTLFHGGDEQHLQLLSLIHILFCSAKVGRDTIRMRP